MLRSTFYSFTTALRGLNTAQKQLDVTGQNISNVNTVGYTRQRADTYASVAAGYGDKYASIVNSSLVGQGSVIGGISQIRDPFLDVRFRGESSAVGEQDAKTACMEDILANFDEIEKSGIMKSFSNFISKLQSYSGDTSSSELDSITRDAASTVVNQLKQYASQLSTIRDQEQYQLKEITVPKMNELLNNIANINDSIQSQEVAGGSALELKDERNLLLDELSSYVNLDVSYKSVDMPNGSTIHDVVISMVGADGNKTALVYNNQASKFSAALPGQKDSSGKTVNEAVVELDNSDIQAKLALDPINKAIASIGAINKQISTNVTALAANTTEQTAQTAARAAAVAAGDTAKVASIDAILAKLATEATTLTNNNTALVTSRTSSVGSLNTELTKYGVTATPTDTDSNPTTVNDYTLAFTNPDLSTTTLISGTTRTDMTKDSLIKAGAIFKTVSANSVQSQGALKGSLEMLNSKGTFDFNNNEVRGIGYYENMLNSLANQFANKLNELNSTVITPNADGTNSYDKALFETSDKSNTITAANIRIADAWLKGTYGITASKQPTPDGGKGARENILLMISACSSKLDYKANAIVKQDTYGNYLNSTGNIVANGKDANGNYTLKFANSSGVAYNPDGTLTTTPPLTITANPDGTYTSGGKILTKNSSGDYIQTVANRNCLDTIGIVDNMNGTYSDASGNIIANGKDAQGNYTVVVADSALNGLNPDGTPAASITVTPNTDGTYTDNLGRTLTKDASGNYILKVASADKVPYNASGSALSTTSSLAARTNSFIYNGTFQEFLANTANVISLDVSNTSNLLANHTTVVNNIQSSRDALSSVSIDEEGINMLQFQKAYNAAARLMTTLDEAVSKLLEMGVVGR